ncbi:Na/Pi cotransporter family protein [Thiomicrorhabdus heinhorstiae]|uniref:Na/Pi cotransporter family protein n=1 Tax=Thiomicrorhabdus heinhorstiae TaxID=2748010 RepID=A0ABS0BSG5_9GAMM|nr:Na/Pi symporter [Thiomicrorhabdus heinhorstiae]MBF6056740.1 Na/Pi cotransporter family protein [Thiomicrorhabdus heinhorstiae]
MQEFHSLILISGGLGLFLLGMIIMTDGLKKLAGDQIRSALFHFTQTPTSGALTGAISTAIVQSSSATTVAAVGFVGAGLMTFSNALGVIFGANIGTTMTGWMVALLGFKFSIDTIAMPIILVGVLLRLFSKGKVAQTGLAIAGFGLIFVGIETMQAAMAGMRDFIDFSQLPANNLIGQLQLLVLGLTFTLITQSSSAGVAVTLTALFTGMIEFEQAAALVIGMDVGTTATSIIATIGGTVGAKRTGYSHVFYNLITAIMALMLITPYTLVWEYLAPGSLQQNAEIALVGFHSLFNLLGVILILPFTKQFANLMYKLVPQTGSNYIDRLDKQLLQTPELALTAAQNTLLDLMRALVNELNYLTGKQPLKTFHSDLTQLQQDLDQTQYYLDAIHLNQNESHLWKRLISMIHMLDHLQRLHERCEEESDRAKASKLFPTLQPTSNRMAEDIEKLLQQILQGDWAATLKLTEELNQFIERDAEFYRHKMVDRMGQGEISADQCWDSLEAIRWMKRVSNHLYRISYHLQQMLLSSGK